MILIAGDFLCMEIATMHLKAWLLSITIMYKYVHEIITIKIMNYIKQN